MQEIERCQHCGTPRALAGASPYCATCGRKFPRRVAVLPSSDEPTGSEGGRGWLLAPRRRTDAGPPGTTGESSGPIAVQAPTGGERRESGGRSPLGRGVRLWLPVALLGAVGSGLLAVLVALALRSGSPAPTEVPATVSPRPAWAYRFAEGRDLHYRVTISLTGSRFLTGGSRVTQREDLAIRVRSVRTDGSAEVTLRTSGGTVSWGGRREALPAETERATVAPDGWITPTRGRDRASLATDLLVPGLAQLFPLLPDRGPAPGETWSVTRTVRAPLGRGTGEYRLEGRLVRFEQEGSRQLAVIESEASVPFQFRLDAREARRVFGDVPGVADLRVTVRGELNVEQTTWFDPERGRAVRGSGEGAFDVRIVFQGLPAGSGQRYSFPRTLWGEYRLRFEARPRP